MKPDNTLYITNRKAWRQWLAKNHKNKTDVWLIFYRKETGKPGISYNAAVEEALCYGWIDSIVKKIDNERYMQRFSVRRKNSILSQLNRERIRHLIRKKKMTKAGLAAVAHAFNVRDDEALKFKIPSDILKALLANKNAWRYFQHLPDSYKRIRIAYIESQRKHGEEAFRRALENFIKKTAQNKRIGTVKGI